MFDNFTDSMKEITYNAQNMAIENHNTMIEPIHILNSIIEENNNNNYDMTRKIRISDTICDIIQELIKAY